MKIKQKKEYGQLLWLYTKYQLITKGLFALIVMPIFGFAIQAILKSSGRTNISSGDYLSFLFSFNGLELLVLALVLLTLMIGLDINAFIIMSGLIEEKKIGIRARDMILAALKSLRSFLRPSGLLLLLYVAFIVPLISAGVSLSPLKDFQIPNFITSVIFASPLLKGLYIALLAFLAGVTFFYIFTFHYILIAEKAIGPALTMSAALMKKHWKQFLKDAILKGALRVGAIILIIVALNYILLIPLGVLQLPRLITRFWLLFTIFLSLEILAFVALMAIPVAVSELTKLFYRYNQEDGIRIQLNEKYVPKLLKTEQPLSEITAQDSPLKAGEKPLEGSSKKLFSGNNKLQLKYLLLALLCVNLLAAVVYTAIFDRVFHQERSIQIIAHRGGGDLAAENSIAGLEAAIEAGASWSEIDVQRTKDGHYIINHDPNLKRVTGVNKKSTELSLAEIKELEVQDLFDPTRAAQPVATIEEFLDTAKGKIGLFVELKGATADEQMVDDVVAMIKERKMEKECVLLSLDYDLIKLIEAKYPEMDSGFLYFFAVGDIASMKGDYLIMEEAEAVDKKIKEIKNAGKKAVVWTVNTDESIVKYIHSNVDGIITDHVLKVKAAMEESQAKTDFEAIKLKFFGY
ncbi:MAG: glycerophosphodiester phosphodiesterase family protein [Eubacteriales bacterium]|nr:glycerophosphodiester phosphodiesterase family protein [Eubacteriales bacterium]